jgi:hypothetical protein
MDRDLARALAVEVEEERAAREGSDRAAAAAADIQVTSKSPCPHFIRVGRSHPHIPHLLGVPWRQEQLAAAQAELAAIAGCGCGAVTVRGRYTALDKAVADAQVR